MPSKIEWTEETWNPVTGCTKVSPGCTNCYADALCRRFWKQWDREPPPDHFQVKLHPDRLDQPLRWKKPQRVFVCSMSDFFHPAIPLEFQVKILSGIRRCPQHTFQILTKRAGQMALMEHACGIPELPNLWLGVTAESQERADERIPPLLQTPAAIRFVSVEPMLGPVKLFAGSWMAPVWFCTPDNSDGLDWVIIGCESGPNRRPMDLEWALDLVRQCQATGIPVFVKQLDIDGRVSKEPTEWPEELRIREYPRR